jgi:hypothetical protein
MASHKSRRIPPCTNCGSRLTVRTGNGWGTVKIMYDEKGKEIDCDKSRFNYTASSVIRCAECNHVRRDVKLPSPVIEVR